MTGKKSNDIRRKLLKSITAGSGAVATSALLPDNWVKPAMKSILLPAHALTTDVEGIVPDGTWEGTIEFGEEAVNNSSISVGSLAQRLGNILISPAYACLLGGHKLKIEVEDQKATVSSDGSLVGEANFDGFNLNLSGVHMGGMKLNLQAAYLSNENEMQVDIQGLNNAIQCAGVNGSGTLK